MKLLIDTREQQALVFEPVIDVVVLRATLVTGDYTAEHDGVRDDTVVERKNVGDLFGSFTSGYERERAKILRAHEANLHYVLAIEASASEVMKGHTYWKDGQLHESKKTGMGMIRQLSMLQRKYGVVVWYCGSRREMSWRIMEFFLAEGRRIAKEKKERRR